MRSNITRRLAAAVVVPVALVGFTACNDDNDDTSGTEDETTSQESTDSGETDEASEGGDPAVASAEQVSNDDFAKIVAAGLEETTTAKLKMEITASGVATTAEGAIDYTGKQPATQLSMTVPGSSDSMDVIMVDGVIYMTMPIEGQQGYFKVDPKSNPEIADQLGGLDSLDMASMMETFTDGLQSVETVGTEEIEGVETTHYKVKVDTEAAQEMLSGLEGAQGAEAPEVPEELVYDLWLDGEGRFAQMEADIDGQGTMKMNVYDYGADVSIEAPPADQVQDMSSMMSGS